VTVASKRAPRLLLLLALLALLGGTAAMLLTRSSRGPRLGGPNRIERHTLAGGGAVPPGTGIPGFEAGDASELTEIVAPANLTVRVLRLPDRSPVPGAKVLLLDGKSAWTGIADAAGEVHFEGFEAGQVTVFGEAPGLKGFPRAVVSAGFATQPAEYMLFATKSIEGHVTSADDGRPVPAASVVAKEQGFRQGPEPVLPRGLLLTPPRPTATTDARGGFRLEGVRVGAWIELQVEANGFLKGEKAFSSGQPGVPVAVEIPLESAVRVKGIVRDPGGRPVAGARVRMLPGYGPRDPGGPSGLGDSRIRDGCTYTAADGSYTLEGLVPGCVYSVEAQSGGFAPSTEGRAVFAAPGVRELHQDLTLGSSGSLILTWRAPGAPAPDAAFVYMENLDLGESWTTYRELGKPRMERLRPGRYRIVVIGAGVGTGAVEATVPAGGDTTAEVVLGGGFRVSGVVVDGGGRPVAGVDVSVLPDWRSGPVLVPAAANHGPGSSRTLVMAGSRWARESGMLPGGPSRAKTDDEGRFRIEGILPGSQHRLLAASGRTRFALTGPVAAPSEGIRIVLTTPGAAGGRLVPPPGGNSPAEMVLHFRSEAPSWFTHYHPDDELRRLTPFGDGRFRLEGLPAGPGFLRAEAGPLLLEPVAVMVPSGGDLDLGDLRLVEGMRLEGRAVDPAGTPVEGAAVALAFGPPSASTDAAGKFELVGLPPGGGTTRVWKDGFLRSETTTKPGDGPVEIVLFRGGMVRLVAFDRGGVPLAGRAVVVVPKAVPGEPGFEAGRTGVRGEHQVRLPPGEYHLEIHSPDGAVLASGDAVVREGGEVSVELRAQK
jgi:protocatechuate 3,4-dioxygenase beta subunit